MKKPRLLLVDDDPLISESLAFALDADFDVARQLFSAEFGSRLREAGPGAAFQVLDAALRAPLKDLESRARAYEAATQLVLILSDAAANRRSPRDFTPLLPAMLERTRSLLLDGGGDTGLRRVLLAGLGGLRPEFHFEGDDVFVLASEMQMRAPPVMGGEVGARRTEGQKGIRGLRAFIDGRRGENGLKETRPRPERPQLLIQQVRSPDLMREEDVGHRGVRVVGFSGDSVHEVGCERHPGHVVMRELHTSITPPVPRGTAVRERLPAGRPRQGG